MSNEKLRAAIKARLKLSEDMRNMGRPPHPDYWVQSIYEVEAQMREALALPIAPPAAAPAPAVPQATPVTHDMREAGMRAAREVAEILNISVNTIDVQMAIAVKRICTALHIRKPARLSGAPIPALKKS